MHTDFLMDVFRTNADAEALVWKSLSYTYKDLINSISTWDQFLEDNKITPGTVVSVQADFSPNAVGLMLALISKGTIFVPLTSSVESKKDEYLKTAEVEVDIILDSNDETTVRWTEQKVSNQILKTLQDRTNPGLVLFSSGSTGKSKAAVHDFIPLLEKFKVAKRKFRTISFLLFDHIGGVNTLLYTLSNGGCLITTQERSPEAVCKLIQDHQIEILPTSPTFINMLLISRAYEKFDLSSLQLVTYGTEVMQESTLKRFNELFPEVRLQQTYGLSELGILRSKSKSSDSLWVKVGGEGYQTRIVDGKLEIKAESAMLGYLNAPSPFTEDGWFITGDAVEVDGEFIKILGRESEIINVGGEKVYPAEVESVLQMMEGVDDVIVTSEKNALTGQMVKAKVILSSNEELKDYRKRMRDFCKDRLEKFKIPQKVELLEKPSHGTRFKRMRLDLAD